MAPEAGGTAVLCTGDNHQCGVSYAHAHSYDNSYAATKDCKSDVKSNSATSTSSSGSSTSCSTSGRQEANSNGPLAGYTSQIHSRVPHIPQRFGWDCGLACVLMLLQGLGVCDDCDYEALRQLCPTTSIWTIDLAHLLAHYGHRVAFTTTTIGINSDYANEGFYIEHMEEDQRRVQRLFADAPAAGITVEQRSLSLAELAQAVSSGEQLAIALVDKRKLDPWQAAADICWNYTTGYTSATGYTGHYVLLVGWDASRQEFWVQDPARGQGAGPIRVAASVLDAARRSFGTDEDLLLVPSAAAAADAQQRQGHVGAALQACEQWQVTNVDTDQPGVQECLQQARGSSSDEEMEQSSNDGQRRSSSSSSMSSASLFAEAHELKHAQLRSHPCTAE